MDFAPCGVRSSAAGGAYRAAGRTKSQRIVRIPMLQRLLFCLFIALCSPAVARAPQAPDAAKTLDYIHHAWATLTRSLTDCSALRDVKIAAHPVLYLPA